MITILSRQAQEERRNLSENTRWGIVQVNHKKFLGFIKDADKYIGDAILQKTYTIDFLTKKRVKNNGYVKKYYVRNSHEAIITKEQFYLVQEEMKRRSCTGEKSTGKRKLCAIKLSNLYKFESFIAHNFY